MIETQGAKAQQVLVTEDSLTVDLMNGRTIAVPLAWYPRLFHGTPAEHRNWRLMGQKEISPIDVTQCVPHTRHDITGKLS